MTSAMKKLLLLTIVVALTINTSAQNYSAFVPGRDAYYIHLAGFNDWQVDAIQTDSIGLSGSFTEYTDYRREIPSPAWNQGCLNFADTGWMGHSILRDINASRTIFMNWQNDSIVFNHGAAVGQNGMMYYFPNGDKIVGTVSTLGTMTFMSISDSVKTISLQAFDASNNSIVHDFNGKTIIVSKTRGIVRAYNWKKFPTDTVSYSLYGMTNPQEGIDKQNASTIFDYNIGDQFDIEIRTNPNAMSYPDQVEYISRYVTNKSFSMTGDTIYYGYVQDRTVKIGTTIVFQITGQGIGIPIVLSDSTTWYDLDLLPLEFANGPDTNSGYYGKTPGWPYDANLYNGRVQQSFNYQWWWYYDQDSTCYYPANLSWGMCDGQYKEWAQGVGQVYGYNGSATCYVRYYLRYFDKGTEVWGNPHDWGTINSVNDNTEGSVFVTAWPNPAKSELNITLPGVEKENLTYQIYSISGQLIETGNSAVSGGILQIPVNQLAEGVYNVVILGEQQSWTTRFVK